MTSTFDHWPIRDFDRYRSDKAACRGCAPDLWYPERGESHRHAIDICNTCPVRDDCLEFALTNNERYGIWGGYSERQRRRMRAERRKNEEAA